MDTKHNVRNDIEQRMRAYLPHEQHMVTLFMNLPSDAQRLGAADQAVKITQQILDQEAQQEQEDDDDDSHVHHRGGNYDSDDSDSEMMGNYNNLDEQKANARKFIYALQDCPMILGFHAVMTHGTADQCCYCPCSVKLQPWRTYHEMMDVPKCAANQKFDPNGFVAHLNKVSESNNINDNGTATYHRVVLRYLHALYQNYWGPNIHHRGLYIVGTTEYKKALAEEKKQDVKMMHRLQEDLNKAQQQKIEAEERADRWEKIKSINPDLLELKEKYDKKMNLLVQLGLAVKTESGVEIIGKKTKPFTKIEIERFEDHHSTFIEWCAVKFQKNDAFHQTLQIQYDDQGDNPISKWFNAVSQNKNDSTFFFGKSIKNSEGVIGDFFAEWKLTFISFTNPDKKLKTYPSKKFKTEFEVIETKKKKDALEAKDAGGPTRNFLSQLWNQIITITVPIQQNDDTSIDKRIFEGYGEYVVPTQDIKVQATSRARCCYQAIGRIIAYCILHKETIADHILPDLFKNYLLRNITPTCPEYDLSELINDFFEMSKSSQKSSVDVVANIEYVLVAFGRNGDDSLLEDADDMSLKEDHFRKCIDDEIFKPRRLALDELKKGIQLEGYVPCERCFSVIPLAAVKKLLFDDAGYDLDFVLSRMEPIHEFGKSKIDTTVYLETQNLFFKVSSENLKDREGTFVDLLRKKYSINNSFIRDFVWFVTGSYYIRQSDFHIKLEFNYSENWDENALPMVHTCENTIKFPALVYFNNAETLEEKLDYAMNYAKNCSFDMA